MSTAVSNGEMTAGTISELSQCVGSRLVWDSCRAAWPWDQRGRLGSRKMVQCQRAVGSSEARPSRIEEPAKVRVHGPGFLRILGICREYGAR